mmetsp:Transcript_40324/g.94395  ORF Transcript_40324/g.94395 Transcript_40324/m.94395 type:complete len:220 (+) Transcript_40324:1156-1815(+)
MCSARLGYGRNNPPPSSKPNLLSAISTATSFSTSRGLASTSTMALGAATSSQPTCSSTHVGNRRTTVPSIVGTDSPSSPPSTMASPRRAWHGVRLSGTWLWPTTEVLRRSIQMMVHCFGISHPISWCMGGVRSSSAAASSAPTTSKLTSISAVSLTLDAPRRLSSSSPTCGTTTLWCIWETATLLIANAGATTPPDTIGIRRKCSTTPSTCKAIVCLRR